MITNKDIRVENGFLIINGDKYSLDGQSPEAIMQIVEDNSDTTPTENSTAPITSGGVYAALEAKQDTLTFDTAPTAESTNPVTSAGIKTYVDTKTGDIKSSILMGRGAFPAAEIGEQEVLVNFPAAFAHTPAVMVSWDDTASLTSYFKYPLLITGISTTNFKVKAERLNANSNWYFRYIAIDIN